MTNTYKTITVIALIIFIIGAIYLAKNSKLEEVDMTPQNVTLSGNYVCLPHLDASGPQTLECAFGLVTDDGVYYAVNFGARGSAMEQFQSKAHIKAEGFVIMKEALDPQAQWAKYNMKGMFTITKMIEPAQ